jgi:hypothetical protein
MGKRQHAIITCVVKDWRAIVVKSVRPTTLSVFHNGYSIVPLPHSAMFRHKKSFTPVPPLPYPVAGVGL